MLQSNQYLFLSLASGKLEKSSEIFKYITCAIPKSINSAGKLLTTGRNPSPCVQIKSHVIQWVSFPAPGAIHLSVSDFEPRGIMMNAIIQGILTALYSFGEGQARNKKSRKEKAPHSFGDVFSTFPSDQSHGWVSWDVWRHPVVAASARPVYCGMVSEGASTELGRL